MLSPVIDDELKLKHLDLTDIEVKLDYVGQALEAIREGIGSDKALIGFAGAPYTLASYMVEGGGIGRISKLKLLAYRKPHFVSHLLDLLSDVVIAYLKMQVNHGADVIQLFDTWAGELSPADFASFELPRVKKIVQAIKQLNVPVIYFVNGVAGLLEHLPETGADVLGVDWRISIGEFRKRVGDQFAVQGNLDPLELYAPTEHIRKRVREIHREAGMRGHIFNLGHGILPDVPVENAIHFVKECQRVSKR